VDTNILCEPQQKRPNAKVVSWLAANEGSLYTSVLVAGEIQYGINLLPMNSGRRARLQTWLDKLLGIMEGRVLSVNTRVAQEWAQLQTEAQSRTSPLPVVDSLLAATARRYKLTMATANSEDFRVAGLKTVNPFKL
jgi:predicted nucleic acid-binding protein